MKKLTPTQQEVMRKLWDEIALARKCKTFEEYYNAYWSKYHGGRKFSDAPFTKQFPLEWYVDIWEKLKAGEYLARGTHGTMRALERLGYIEIVELDNTRCNIDKVKVIRYEEAATSDKVQ